MKIEETIRFYKLLPTNESIRKMSREFGESMYFADKTSAVLGFQEGAKVMREYIKKELEKRST